MLFNSKNQKIIKLHKKMNEKTTSISALDVDSIVGITAEQTASHALIDIDDIINQTPQPLQSKAVVDVDDVIDDYEDDHYEEDDEDPWNDDEDEDEDFDDIINESIMDAQISAVQQRKQETFDINDIEVTPIKPSISYIPPEPKGFVNISKEFSTSNIKDALDKAISSAKADTKGCELTKFEKPVIKIRVY